jgi:hypothetical protein
MPTIRKMTQEEVEDFKGHKLSQRQRTAREYDAMIEGFTTGDWGEVTLSEEDNRLTVRSRLQAAAERRGFALAFQRTQGSILRFEVIPPESKEESANNSPSTPRRRGGRPRKQPA